FQSESEGIPSRRLNAHALPTQRLPQMNQVVAEIVQRLVLLALRPERACQPGALYRATISQHQQRQQPFDRAGTQAREGFSIHQNPKWTEELEGERRSRHSGFGFPCFPRNGICLTNSLLMMIFLLI